MNNEIKKNEGKTVIEKGLYKNLNVSVKVLNGVIATGISILAILITAAVLRG